MSTDHDAPQDATQDALQAKQSRAYAAFDEGDLAQAARLFGELIEHAPEVS